VHSTTISPVSVAGSAAWIDSTRPEPKSGSSQQVTRRVQVRSRVHDHEHATGHDALLAMLAGAIQLHIIVARLHGDAVAPNYRGVLRYASVEGCTRTNSSSMSNVTSSDAVGFVTIPKSERLREPDALKPIFGQFS